LLSIHHPDPRAVATAAVKEIDEILTAFEGLIHTGQYRQFLK
jgi:hypothetical protein